jgi:hypothetical protein
MALRIKKPHSNLLVLTIADDIFCVGTDLLAIWDSASSSIIIDIQKHIQREGFLLLKDIGIECLIFGRKFPVDMRSIVSVLIGPYIDFFAARSFHDMLKYAKSFAGHRFGKLDRKLFLHTTEQNNLNIYSR